jgi:hypothetical protein
VRTVAEEYDRVVGVDTHTMTLLTATGGVVEHRTFPTSAAGLHRALAWIRDRTQTRTCLVVVEGTGSYGAQLTEHFTQGGILVAEAPTVPAARHRGKNDVLDSCPDRPYCAGVAARSALLAACRGNPDRDPCAGLRARPDEHRAHQDHQQPHRADPQRRPRC